MIDRVSEITRYNWGEVLKMNIFEFLNILCYGRDKNEEQKRQIENFKRKH
mgnify:CR=1 FL=1